MGNRCGDGGSDFLFYYGRDQPQDRSQADVFPVPDSGGNWLFRHGSCKQPASVWGVAVHLYNRCNECRIYCGRGLVAQWFPKKKGIVMGYTTMGHNYGHRIFRADDHGAGARLGVANAVVIPAVLVCILAVVGVLLMRNTPQERHINPDNVSDEVYRREYFKMKSMRTAAGQ